MRLFNAPQATRSSRCRLQVACGKLQVEWLNAGWP